MTARRLLGLTISLLLLVAGCSSAPPATVTPTAGLDWFVLQSAYVGMTDEQRQDFAEQLKGTRIEGWSGTVTNVTNSEDYYLILVDMDATGGHDVALGLDKRVATEFAQHDPILFGGTIISFGEGSGGRPLILIADASAKHQSHNP